MKTSTILKGVTYLSIIGTIIFGVLIIVIPSSKLYNNAQIITFFLISLVGALFNVTVTRRVIKVYKSYND